MGKFRGKKKLKKKLLAQQLDSLIAGKLDFRAEKNRDYFD